MPAAPTRDPPASAPNPKKARHRKRRVQGPAPGADDSMEETLAEEAMGLLADGQAHQDSDYCE